VETVPTVVDQVTPGVYLPLTVAVNCRTLRDGSVASEGEMMMFVDLPVPLTGKVVPPQATKRRVKAQGRTRSIRMS
jgi:hypothetical protein